MKTEISCFNSDCANYIKPNLYNKISARREWESEEAKKIIQNAYNKYPGTCNCHMIKLDRNGRCLR